MLFNSLPFLIFLPVVVLLYYLLPQRFRWILIFVASSYFYMAFVPKYILILFFIILVDYFSGIAIEGAKGRRRKLFLALSLIANILLLSFFKYFNFLNENLSNLTQLCGGNFQPVNLSIILPIGLSFHTFQSMSYTIEVYRGKQKAERHLGYFANYVLFFPQMVAGPIERYEGLGNALKEKHTPLYKNFSDGFRLVLFGLFVKMVVADNIAPYVNAIYENPLAHSRLQVLMGVILFSFQIYADFYGYSTIALGSAMLLGVRIMDNFKTPYLSLNITEFWNRWHISLSTWFKDYLYIPLGGNRVKLPRWMFNIMFVFMVSGLWHGASWTFVVWGALHGMMLVFERLVGKIVKFKNTGLFLKTLLALKTFLLVAFIWIFFRAENFSKAKEIIKILLKGSENSVDTESYWPALFFSGVLILTDLWLYNTRIDRQLERQMFWQRWSIYTLLIFGLLALAGTKKYTFIYFQF